MESEKINLQSQEVENEEDDDGPPPGFQCVITPQSTQLKKAQVNDDDEDEDEDDGPPPGFGPVAPQPQPPLASSDKERSIKQEHAEDDDDGPPPGWEFSSLARALPKPPSIATDIKTEKREEPSVDEEDDDGPPPGWETVLPRQMQPCSFDQKMGSKQDAAKSTERAPEAVSRSTLVPERSSPPKPPVQPQSSTLPGDISKGQPRNRVKRPTAGKQSASAQQMPPPAPQPPAPGATSSSTDLAQLVCGTCRKLCTYPRGAKLVRCPSCMEVNFAMEAHEVGQVKCKGCSMLLMYPYGAPAVQCTTCRTVTGIGAHNRRAPLSVQQNQRRRRSHKVR